MTSILIVCIIVIGELIGFVNLESENGQGTPVSGPIIVDTTWDLVGSPYIVIDDIWVEVGVILTIEPGVNVKFDGSFSIFVDGNIMAVGNEINEINITSNKATPFRNDWNNIQINYNGHADIEYCNITYGGFGIYLDSSNNNIKNNYIAYNEIGIHLDSSSNNNITNNIILNNIDGVQVLGSSNNIILNNTISSSIGKGLFIEGSSNNAVANNDILDNGDTGDYGVGLELSSSSNIVITANNFINDGVEIIGNQLSHFNSHTIPENNLENYKPLYYFKDTNDFSIDGIPIGQIILANCSNGVLKNLHINDTETGILAAYSTNITITNNNLSSNKGNGIGLFSSHNNNITNNTISKMRWAGIAFEYSSENNIINNHISLSDGGIFIGTSSYHNIVRNNNVFTMDEWAIWAVTSSYNIISNNNVRDSNLGISLLYSSLNNTINGNNVSNNNYGICIGWSSSVNVIKRNFLSFNNYSVYIWDSSNSNYISNNNISESKYGIYIKSFSNGNIITSNTISKNQKGIYLETSSNNRIYHNIIIINDVQALDNMNNNFWNESYPSGGNYWSDFDEPGDGAYDDYQGAFQTVLGSDGIVDNGTVGGGGINPYMIDSDSMDHYPLLRNYIFLHEGWNLISIPLIQSDPDLDTVLSSISGSYDAVQWYNKSDSPDQWKHNHISKPTLWNDLKDIDHKIGFWIHITKPGGVIFECPGVRPIVNQTITLYPGWNLVGYPSLSSKVRMEALNNINFGADVDAIWTYNTTGSVWEEMTKVDYFERGKGYWIHSKVEKVWNVPL